MKLLNKYFSFKNDRHKITKIASGFAHSGCVIKVKKIFIWEIIKI